LRYALDDLIVKVSPHGDQLVVYRTREAVRNGETVPVSELSPLQREALVKRAATYRF
jgi:hypothetical protein